MKKKLIWITGLSGSGKTMVATIIFEHIKQQNVNTVMIDGDMFREIFENDLGHNLADRIRNAYRIVRMCKYLCDQDINVVCSTMSLYKEIHQFIYENFENPCIFFLDVSMKELKRRNKKKLYSTGTNVSGLDLPYDEPVHEKFVVKVQNNDDLEGTIRKLLEKVLL